jgi:hypothetical protein
MKAKEYIDEIKLRLDRMVVGLTIDTFELLHELNAARREVQIRLLPFLGNRFGSILKTNFNLASIDTKYIDQNYDPTSQYVVYSFAMPDAFIRPVAVYVDNDNVIFNRYEARPSTLQELYGAVLNKWMLPRFDDPMYAYVYHSNNLKEIKIAIGNAPYVATEVAAGRLVLEIWYVRALDLLDINSDVDNLLPLDSQEIVILEVIKRVMQKYMPTTDIGLLRRKLQNSYQLNNQNYYEEEAMKVEVLQENKG